MRVLITLILALTSLTSGSIRGSTGAISSEAEDQLFKEIVDCISPSSNEKSFLCMLKKGFSANQIRDSLLRPQRNVCEKPLALDGITVKAWSYGSTERKPASIILLPGMGEHQGVLRGLAKSLMGHFNVFSLDVAGYGTSEGECSHNLMETAVGAVMKLMGHYELENESTVVVGHSLGGVVAQNLGLKIPSLLGVVNIDGGCFTLDKAPTEKAAIIKSEAGDVPEDQGPIVAELMSYGPSVIEDLKALSGEINAELHGATDAWESWLESWYGAGGWEQSFSSLQPQTLIIKAAKSPESKNAWTEILTEYFNSDRQHAIHPVEVVAVVSTHLMIVLSPSSIEAVSLAITEKFSP